MDQDGWSDGFKNYDESSEFLDLIDQYPITPGSFDDIESLCELLE